MSTVKYTPRLAEKYKKEVVPALMKKFNYETVMQAPKLEKICINRGVNGAVTDKKLVEVAVDELSMITGQKAVTTQSKKDISNILLWDAKSGAATKIKRSRENGKLVRVSKKSGEVIK